MRKSAKREKEGETLLGKRRMVATSGILRVVAEEMNVRILVLVKGGAWLS